MRIIAGSRKGHRIAAPKGDVTRPTSDFVRETAFNLIGPVDGAAVLDLYAGSGAMGLEALSRGAESCVFVDSDREACRTINANLDKLRFEARVLCLDAARALAAERGDLRPRAARSALRRGAARSGSRRTSTASSPRTGCSSTRPRSTTEPEIDGLVDPHLAPLRRQAAYAVRAVITAICPGSFDPVTNGHVDVITRAAHIFDRVVVGVVGSPQHKTPLFPIEMRIELVKGAFASVPNVEVDVFKELVVDFARRWEAQVIVKGLRVISDFEYEFQMNHLNRTLAPDIETVYVMASPQVSFVSSSGVKEIASFGGNVEELVPPAVARRLREAFPNGRGGTPLSRPGVTSGPMDVLVLIDKLDDLVHNAKAVPLTDQVRIDREEIYDILDQMRATIPEEIKQARWIVKERQEMLAEAKREQDRLLQEAREQAVREASQTEIVKLAERQAQEIIDEARRQSREMRLEMEDWADGMLATLESNLDRFLTAVRRGRERLHERSQETVVAGIGPIDVGDDASNGY